MVTALLWFVAAIALLLAMLPVAAAVRFGRYVRTRMATPPKPFTPKLSVILPCKGVDPGFDDNVRSLLAQDYPDYELLFVTATEEDPARARLAALLAEAPGARARLVVAGLRKDRSQKLNNQLTALEQARPDVEAYVFVDSDVRAHPSFLRDLVSPLAEEGVGATTGFRWYIPERGGLGSYLRATWNGGGLTVLADPKLAYAWGGAMAILRGTFDRAGVAQRWEHALTDDFPLTDAVRSIGLTVRFVPHCLLGSHEDAPLSGVIEWTNRQTIICRVYNPKLWRALFVIHAFHAAVVLLALAVIGLKLWRPAWPVSMWPAVLMLASLPVEAAAGVGLWASVRRLLPQIGGWGRALKHLLLAPAAVFLIFYNSVHSVMTSDIRWRGVCYRLHSSDRTEVLTAT